MKTIAVPGGGTMLTWTHDFVQSGHALDSLLRQRAHVLTTSENAAISAPLRSATVGLLGRFRNALRDEIEEDGSPVPKDHEAKLFAYFDQLASTRASTTASETSTAAPATENDSLTAP